MTAKPHADAWARLGRTLYDITQLLESTNGAEQRMRRVLELLGGFVPYEECALLEARLGHDPEVVVVPEASRAGRLAVTDTLLALFGQLVDDRASAPPAATRLEERHLAVPLIGLDEVVGLLFVRSSVDEYTEDHLRVLSVVAAHLAAYITTLRAHGELTALARERDQARHAAESANRAKDDFLALVSNELKTPLGAILTSAQRARAATDDVGAHTLALDELERNVETQARLIDDILDLACIASAELRLDLRVIEPAALIEATIERLRREAERKSIRLESDLDPAAMPLLLDPDRIGQVVAILIGNAIRFTAAGGHVEVRLASASGYARIQVSDSGTGISREALPRIFDHFQRAAEAGTRGDRGLGVGLALVKQLVTLHGGRVRAESEGCARGASFTVELPRLAELRALPGQWSAGDRAADRELTGVHVLLVDHDLGLRESFQSALESHGAAVTAVASAPEALAALERARWDVLLLGDLELRGEGVYDLMREVTARACPLPVASISAWRLEDRERQRSAGFRLQLAKPLEMGALVDAVADLVGQMPAWRRRRSAADVELE
jgi:signal transduction histidine kinase